MTGCLAICPSKVSLSSHMRKNGLCINGIHQRSHPQTQDLPAGHNDDILCNARHLLDGQVAHPTEGGLGKKWEKPCDPQTSMRAMDRKKNYRKHTGSPLTGEVTFPWSSHHPITAVPSQEKLRMGHLHHWTERAWSWQKRPQLLQ